MNTSIPHNARFLLFKVCTACCAVCFFAGCLNMAGDCETEVKDHYFNPDKSLQAVTVVTDCGATTTPSTGVRIVEGSDTTDVSEPENTILGSRVGVDIKWLAKDTLLITGADITTGFTMKTRLSLKKTNREVIILYK
jgi:hypothetical protein